MKKIDGDEEMVMVQEKGRSVVTEESHSLYHLDWSQKQIIIHPNGGVVLLIPKFKLIFVTLSVINHSFSKILQQSSHTYHGSSHD